MKYFLLGILAFSILAVTGLLLRQSFNNIYNIPITTTDIQTSITQFDPQSMYYDSSSELYNGECTPSNAVQRNGAYVCQGEDGTWYDICIVLNDNTLVCEPNPVKGDYGAIVTTQDLLSIENTGTLQVPIVLQLESGTVCTILDAPAPVDEYERTYLCQNGQAIVGPIDVSSSAWTVFVMQEGLRGQTTSDPDKASVSAAWIW